MNYSTALTALKFARAENLPAVPVHWVSPIVSCICAASTAEGGLARCYTFSGDAGLYADNNGLAGVIAGNYEPGDGEGQQGVTYSQLARLQYAHEIESSNQTISDLFHSQLGSGGATSKLVEVVGELHDNVVSHASGLGFSCGQVYRNSGGNGKRIEFAIADIGCGMLQNVQRVESGITTDRDAIRWCLKKGNTASANLDPWAQRLPEDATYSPIPGPVFRDEGGNHHAGYGLYHLRRLVRYFRGNMWIWTGEAQIIMREGEISALSHNDGAWRGVAIEFEVTVPDNAGASDTLPQELEDLAKRIGLQ